MTNKTNIRQIMIRAWEIARHAAARFGYAAAKFFRAALLQAWDEARRPSRKEIAQRLDRAARRAEDASRRPSSPKQNWYLSGLLFDAGYSPDDIEIGTRDILTSAKASEWISYFVAKAA